jgi:hypothetical protein
VECWQVCAWRGHCFDLRTRKDPSRIGTDAFDAPISGLYYCGHRPGRCVQVAETHCQRRCHDVRVHADDANVAVISGEQLLMARYSGDRARDDRTTEADFFPRRCDRIKVGVSDGRSLTLSSGQLLVTTCTGLWADENEGEAFGIDCINGTWLQRTQDAVNFSILSQALRMGLAPEPLIPSTASLMIRNRTR